MSTTQQNAPRQRLTEWTAEDDDRMSRQQLDGGWLRALPPVSNAERAEIASLRAMAADLG